MILISKVTALRLPIVSNNASAQVHLWIVETLTRTEQKPCQIASRGGLAPEAA
jgi:hypothetical protein